VPTATFHNLPEAKRQLILDLAIEEFAAHDYPQASISRIVARAGIAKGSLYQYFADKSDLYLYLLQLAADEKRAFLESARPPGGAAGFFATLRWLFQAGMQFEFSNPQLAQVGYRAVYSAATTPDAVAVLRGAPGAFFQPLVEQGQASGEIDPALDIALIAFMLNAVMTQLGDFLLSQLARPRETLLTDGSQTFDHPAYWRLVDELLTILERGLRAQRS
jgi:AcrR family transcriptional regulator